MTTPRDINSFGGVKVNAKPIKVPTQEKSAEEDNRVACDLAQLTRTTFWGWVMFTTAGSGGSITPSAGRSHAGSGSGNWPTVTRTGTGLYTVTWPASFADELDEPENISFTTATPSLGGPTAGFVNWLTIVGPVVTLKVMNDAGAASDLGAAGIVTLFVQ